MTPEELDRAVTSLRNVGGLYELVSLFVEAHNRPHVRKAPMLPHYADGMTTVYLDDCLAVLRELPDNSVDAVVTDPPYGLSNTDPRHIREALEHWLAGDREFLPAVGGGGFMGKAWDAFVPPVAVWDECFRVLKPGGHLLSFAGSRTFDLMTLAIRLAGFDIRDSIAWLYGSGFPKSLDVSKAIDKAAGAEFTASPASGVGFMTPTGEGGYNVTKNQLTRSGESTDAAREWQGWGTVLKPAFEPVVVARKPLEGTVAANVLTHGVGALNIDATRVGDEVRTAAFTSLAPAHGNRLGAPGTQEARRGTQGDPKTYTGRWPANVVLDESQAAALDEQSGTKMSRGHTPARRGGAARDAIYGLGHAGQEIVTEAHAEETGGASRFFYVAKAPKSERPVVDGVAHPTVKPLALMRWLIRLVTPPEGVILEPFAGSGTTIEAAILEDKRVIGIEREADYWPLIRYRIARGNDVELPS